MTGGSGGPRWFVAAGIEAGEGCMDEEWSGRASCWSAAASFQRRPTDGRFTFSLSPDNVQVVESDCMLRSPDTECRS